MPHLVRWHEELGPFGLVVIAPHVQSASRAQVQNKARAMGLTFAVTEGGGVAGGKGGGLPHCFLFDHEGKCLFDGHPTKVEPQLRTAVGKAVIERTGKTSFSKSVQPLIDALRKGSSPAAVLQRAVPLQKTNDDAKALITALTATGKQQIDEATGKLDTDPISAYFQVLRLKDVYKGTAVGTKAGELVGKLKNDKAVVQELKARPTLDTLKKLDAFLSQSTKGVEPTAPEFHKAFAVQLKQLKGTVQKMKTTWPNARATLEALEIADKYGLTIK